MLAFFRINDPYRLIGIFLLIVVIRIPFFLGEMPLTVPELEWMIVGESVSFSNILYLDVWDDQSPLSALAYSMIDMVGGRTQWGYHILAILLVFLQCFLFNQLLITNKAYKENTFVPALIFTILMSAFFDFFTLSPALMSGVFQLLVINGIFNHIATKAKDEQFLNMGLALGFCALIYLPTLAYLPVSILALGLYSSMSLKKYILLFFGFLFPIVLVGIYFFWHGALIDFVNHYLLSWITTPFRELVSFRTNLFVSLTGLLLMVFSWLKIYSASRYNNHQNNYMLVMLLFLAGGIVMVFLSRERVPHQLMVLVTPVAFYLGHLFLLIRRRIVAEIIFLIFFTITMITNYGVLNGSLFQAGMFEYENLLIKETKWDEMVKGKRILIIGDKPDAYLHSYQATPYFNWNLSKKHLDEINSFNNLSLIFENLNKDLPEVILDQKQVVPELFRQMPTISSKYSRDGDAYVLKVNN